MLGDIRDRRTSYQGPHCDAVFEPSAHAGSNPTDPDDLFRMTNALKHPDYFRVHGANDTTVRDAVILAEGEWGLPVTVYLYDKGSKPLG